ncbi:MAG: tRNA (adenosine(37)-N6)-threonylcarbamoyltransferase complex ATPase subunit type 1 TsaE [Caulobacteraceae bacterium]
MRTPARVRLPLEADTERLGQALGAAVERGEAVCLIGPLGAGKSVLARAILRANSEVDEEMPSPTFTLVQHYPGRRFSLAHFDLFRIGSVSEAYELGLDEALADGAAVIEWADRLGGALPDDRLEVVMTMEGAGRNAALTPFGAWEGRHIEL